MRYENLEVEIQRDYFSDSVSVWVVDRQGEKNKHYNISDGNIVETTRDNFLTSELKPFLSMPKHFASVFLEKLISDTKRVGISIKQESEMAGKLKAKEEEIEYLKEQLSKFVNKATQ